MGGHSLNSPPNRFLRFLKPNLVPDFRTQHNNPIDHENKLLREVHSWGETQRLNAIDLYEINGYTPPKFPAELEANIGDNPEKVAETARRILKFSIQEQFNLKSQERINLVKIIRLKLEKIGVLILKNSDLGKCKARVLCIYNDILSIIILGKETTTGSTFTLCHEFAHIILGQSAVSDGVIHRKSQSNINPSVKLAEIDVELLNRLANKFTVSRHAMLVRLVELKMVDTVLAN